MEKIAVFWATTRTNFFVSWNEVPFQSRRTILWRGNVLHFEVSSTEDAKTVIKVHHRNAKGGMLTRINGHNSSEQFYYPAPLASYDSIIQVVFSRNAIYFFEKLAAENLKDTNYDHPGMGFPCPDRVSFDNFLPDLEDHSLEEFNVLTFNEKYNYLLCKSNVNYIAYRSAELSKYYLFGAGEFLIEMLLQDSRICSITGLELTVSNMDEYSTRDKGRV